MDDITKEDFCDKVLQRIESYIEFHIWPISVIDLPRLSKWLNNFRTLDERYFAHKLVNNFIFYNDDDIISLCKFGLEEIIVKREILSNQLIANLTLDSSALEKLKKGN